MSRKFAPNNESSRKIAISLLSICKRGFYQAFIVVVFLLSPTIYGDTLKQSGNTEGPIYTSKLLDFIESNSENIYIDHITDENSELIAIGIGQGSTSNDSQGAGFDGCKLGTGHDANWNVTGLRSIFGPNLNIYFGVKYSNIYSDRWCGRGWYYPDGSVYDERINEYHIPDPADSGYTFWSWYNVYFNFSPMPDNMQSQEGNWTAIWWDEGVSKCSKTYTVMYELFDYAICKDVQSFSPFDPINITSNFEPSDEKCCSWVYLKNYALNHENDIMWEWYKPDGTLYSAYFQDIPDPGQDSWYDWYKVWSSINIYDSAGFYPGIWNVKVYIKDYRGIYELKLTEYFSIGGPSQPDINIQPTQLSVNCNPADKNLARDNFNTQDTVESRQSTTGPVPPPGVIIQTKNIKDTSGGEDEHLLPVPAYEWRHGCGPTALAMIIGYYDNMGYQDLFPGDAIVQSSEINQLIVSKGDTQNPRHYEDYSLPDDFGMAVVLPDKSELPAGDEHQNDCIADFMKTSWSSEGNFYSWSWSHDIGPAFVRYVNHVNPDYEPSYQFYYKGNNQLTWDILTREIDAEKPMMFLVDTEGDGFTDHFVTVIGYREIPTQQYACLDTWYPYDTIRWCDFETIQAGQPWGIWAGFLFNLEPLPQDSFVISNDGSSALTVSSIVPETSAPWLDWTPKPPLIIQPGEDITVNVKVDCQLAPCTDTITRLLVYSDESPYPQGVDITVNKPELTGDLSRDCIVEIKDLEMFVQDWMLQECQSDADIYTDCKVDMKDLAVFSEYWLKTLE